MIEQLFGVIGVLLSVAVVWTSFSYLKSARAVSAAAESLQEHKAALIPSLLPETAAKVEALCRKAESKDLEAVSAAAQELSEVIETMDKLELPGAERFHVAATQLSTLRGAIEAKGAAALDGEHAAAALRALRAEARGWREPAA